MDFHENSNETTHYIGLKKPNPWGSVRHARQCAAEWTLDEYVATAYEKFEGKTVKALDAVSWPTKLYPRVVRGGCFDEDADRSRSAARLGSNDDTWRSEDPNVPKSPWWFTNRLALGVGFRLTRPLAEPATADRTKFWDADLESIADHTNDRIDKEGRGARGVSDRELPKAIESLK